jgi:hypothetical protein
VNGKPKRNIYALKYFTISLPTDLRLLFSIYSCCFDPIPISLAAFSHINVRKQCGNAWVADGELLLFFFITMEEIKHRMNLGRNRKIQK